MKTKLFSFLLLLIATSVAFGQTLVSYSFNNDLNPNPTPAVGFNPTLQYYDPPSATPLAPNTLDYSAGYLNFMNNGDYVVLSFDATNHNDMTLQFTGGLGVFLAIANGQIKAFLQVGSSAETQIASQDFSAVLFGGDTYNFSVPIPAASNQPNVKVRIEGTSSSFGIFTYFGIDNLAIVRNTTTISVRSNANAGMPNINYSEAASVPKDTDFGSLLTNEEILDKTYRITNTGTQTLNLSGLSIAPNDQGFTIVSGPGATTLVPNAWTTFQVRFAPVNQGLMTANVLISGNIVPNNPFIFEVKGAGKSCNLIPVPIAQYGFEGPAPSNMPITQFGSGNIKTIGGQSNSPLPNNVVGGRLYHANNNNSTPLHSSASLSNSWYIRGTDTGEVTLEFGPVDITNQQEVSINFDLAAFGRTNSDNSGVNSSDYILLSVQKPDGSWSDELQLSGNSGTDRVKYAFGAAVLEATYDGNGTAITNNNSTRRGSFKLNIPPSAGITQLKFRIKGYTSRTNIANWWQAANWQNYNLWLIDNVHVDAGNAIFKTWTGTAWTGQNTAKPGKREKAVFAGNYSFTGSENADLEICECEVKSSAVLNIPAGRSLTVLNKVINQGNETNLIVNSDANLVQIENNAFNSGSVTAKREVNFPGGAIAQFNYISSPVANQNIKSIYPGIGYVLRHNESNNMFTVYNGLGESGRGYAVQAATTAGSADATFIGEPHNGEITLPVVNTAPGQILGTHAGNTIRGYNLVGNPYPSNIDLIALHALNGGTAGGNIGSTFYFWDSKANTETTQQGSTYGGQAYAIFNAASGTSGTGTLATGDPGVTGTKIPNRYVKVGQGFNMRSLKSEYYLKFDNSIRTSEQTGSQSFFGKMAAQEDNRYWLQMITPQGIASTIAVVYFDGGTDGFSVDDSPAMGASDMVYSFSDDIKVAINGLPAFTDEHVLPLGNRYFAAGTYKFRIQQGEGVFARGQQIYIKDKLLGTTTSVSDGEYSFEANAGDFTGRFEIVYKPNTVLGTESVAKDQFQVYRDGNDFVIKSSYDDIMKIEVYDMSGRMVHQTVARAKLVKFPATALTEGIYIVKVTHEKGISVKKIRK